MRFWLVLSSVFLGLSTTAWTQVIRWDIFTTVHLSVPSVDTTRSVTAQIFHSFPSYEYTEVQDSLTAERKDIWLQLPIRLAQDARIFIGEDRLQLWLTPNDTVHIQVTSFSQPLSKRFLFRGPSQPLQEYYLAKGITFPVTPSQQALNTGAQAPNLAQFSVQLDSITQQVTNFLQEYLQSHSLPDWFIAYEKNGIRYQDAELRLYMTFYQLDYQRKQQTLPAHYYRFLERLPIRNDSAQYHSNYQQFLSQYVPYYIRQKTGLSYRSKGYQAAFNRYVNQILGRKQADYFRLWSTGLDLLGEPKQVQQELAQHPFLPEYQYLRTYLDRRATTQLATLSKDAKAPPFFLTDTRDSLVSLSQFKGKVVYLCFWFTGCGGCIHEFPHEKQLVDTFAGKPVEIISICTQSSPQQWRNSIAKHKLNTLNLYANASWEKRLEKSYGIQVYPHYVLIDSEGRIAENYTSRPSQDAASKIKQLLKNAGK